MAMPSGTGIPSTRPICAERYSEVRPEPGCRRTRRCGTGAKAFFSSAVYSSKPSCARE